MNLTFDAYRELDRQQSELINRSDEIASSTNQAFSETITKFEMAVDSMKKKHSTEISERDLTIKFLAISLIAVTGCALFLGTKLALLKC